MRITEVNKEHTRLFLYGNGQVITYAVIGEFYWPETSLSYLAFVDQTSLQSHGMWKINGAAVEFDPRSQLIASFRESLSQAEWQFLAEQVKKITRR